MCNWQKWILPGIVAVLLLTGLAMFWQLPAVEANLKQRVSAALAPEQAGGRSPSAAAM